MIRPEDEAALALTLGCGQAELADKLADHGKAALHEYVECYLGRRALSRGSDILEHRLSLLVVHAFGGKKPSAAQVSDLFQTTLSSGRTLVRNTFSKYRYHLDETSRSEAKEVLENVWAGERGCHAKVIAPSLVELLNRRLLTADATLREVGRRRARGGEVAVGAPLKPTTSKEKVLASGSSLTFGEVPGPVSITLKVKLA